MTITTKYEIGQTVYIYVADDFDDVKVERKGIIIGVGYGGRYKGEVHYEVSVLGESYFYFNVIEDDIKLNPSPEMILINNFFDQFRGQFNDNEIDEFRIYYNRLKKIRDERIKEEKDGQHKIKEVASDN